MTNPINKLQEEHKLLLQAVKTASQIQKIQDDKIYYSIMHDVILFFRNFSEIYHHPKEENILYPLLQNKSSKMSEEFLHELCDNHADFKSLIGDIENYYVLYDYRQLRQAFSSYLELLSNHIKRENKIILSIAGDLLTNEEKEIISEKFDELDERHGDKKQLIKDFYKLSLQV